MLFGQDKYLYEFLLSAPRPVYSTDGIVRCNLCEFQITHELILDRLTASQREMLSKQHDGATDSSIEIGDVILPKIHKCHSK